MQQFHFSIQRSSIMLTTYLKFIHWNQTQVKWVSNVRACPEFSSTKLYFCLIILLRFYKNESQAPRSIYVCACVVASDSLFGHFRLKLQKYHFWNIVMLSSSILFMLFLVHLSSFSSSFYCNAFASFWSSRTTISRIEMWERDLIQYYTGFYMLFIIIIRDIEK